MGVSLSEILSTVQQGVTAFNNLGVQVKGSFNNISSQLTAIQVSRASSSTFGLAEVDGLTITASSGVLSILTSPITKSASADIAISNSAYTDGPGVAQGSSGTWFASGTITATDTAGPALISAKLWDGTAVIASARGHIDVANAMLCIALSGPLASPSSNIKISCTSNSSTSGTSAFKFNTSGNSKDSTITAYRIG